MSEQNPSLEERVARLENQNKQLISVCQGLATAGNDQKNLFVLHLDTMLSFYHWQMESSRALSQLPGMEESTRQGFRDLADEAGMNYARLKEKVDQIKKVSGFKHPLDTNRG